MVDPEPVISFLHHFSYLGVFSSIVVSGYILPVPEEIVLLTVGYLASHGMLHVYLAIFVCLIATLVSDIFLYSLAKKDSRFTKKLKTKFQKSVFAQSLLQKPNQVGRAVFLMRFVVGLRFLGPILAGAMNMSIKKFIFYDTLALLLYTPFFVLLGFFFSHSFLRIITQVESIRHILFLIILTIIGIGILSVGYKNLRNLNKSVEEESE